MRQLFCAAVLFTAASCLAEENRPAQPARATAPAKNPLQANVAQFLPALGNMNMLGSLPQLFRDKILPVAIEAFAKSQSGALSGNRTLSNNKAVSDNNTLSGNETLSGNRMSLFSDIKVEVNITIHQHGNPAPAAAPTRKLRGR